MAITVKIEDRFGISLGDLHERPKEIGVLRCRLRMSEKDQATTFLTVAQHGLMGNMRSPVDVTYLADTVILLRYFEATGRVRRAVSVVKKRTGPHEDTIREYQIGSRGVTLGEPLTGFQGILRGVPELVGDPNLLKRADA